MVRSFLAIIWWVAYRISVVALVSYRLQGCAGRGVIECHAGQVGEVAAG